ncbi:MAG: FG-GAP repeat domain-containing protein [Phycisphaerales bacterium JB063]
MAFFTVLAMAGSSAADHPVVFEVQLLGVDANEGCAVADFDNDGRLDVSAGRNWYRNPGGAGGDQAWVPRPLRLLEDANGYTHSNGEYAYDVDGDGFADIISGDFFTDPVKWYRNPGETDALRGILWAPGTLANTGQSSNEIGMLLDIDVDADGTPEWIANQWTRDAPLIVWRFVDDPGTQPGDPPTLVGHTVGPKNGHGIGFGDINNDGRDDILVGTGWYERPEGDPYAGPWTFHADWNDDFSCPMLVRDVNGDGMNDIVWGNPHDYGVFVWLGQGLGDDGKLAFEPVTLDDSFSQAHAIHFADLDGDGRDELITGKRVRGHNGNDPGSGDPAVVVYYTWDEGFEAIERHTVCTGEVGIGLQIRTADLDSDGDLEIVVAGKDGTQILWNRGAE